MRVSATVTHCAEALVGSGWSRRARVTIGRQIGARASRTEDSRRFRGLMTCGASVAHPSCFPSRQSGFTLPQPVHAGSNPESPTCMCLCVCQAAASTGSWWLRRERSSASMRRPLAVRMVVGSHLFREVSRCVPNESALLGSRASAFVAPPSPVAWSADSTGVSLPSTPWASSSSSTVLTTERHSCAPHCLAVGSQARSGTERSLQKKPEPYAAHE
jgi:hypothetical protein